jgi:hypothetical protein
MEMSSLVLVGADTAAHYVGDAGILHESAGEKFQPLDFQKCCG